MTSIVDIEHALNELLESDQMVDYCPNGLQIEGARPVQHIVGGVTASLELIEKAVAVGADALLVHHGYFWKNEPAPVVGMKYQRIKRLIASGMHLLAYHLPLDRHMVLGNNAQLALKLGWSAEGFVDDSLVMRGRPSSSVSLVDFANAVQQGLGRKPLLIESPMGAPVIKTMAWCTGGAQSYIQVAIDAGVDIFISGEISESTTHMARESGVHYLAAGHHATERYGVQAVGAWLAEHFPLTFSYIECDNPA